MKERFVAPPTFRRSIDALASDDGNQGDAVMIHESSVRDRGHHVYIKKKSDWIEKYSDSHT